MVYQPQETGKIALNRALMRELLKRLLYDKLCY